MMVACASQRHDLFQGSTNEQRRSIQRRHEQALVRAGHHLLQQVRADD
jgi:hypothetical protein